MTLAEIIYNHSLHLPEPAAREVLDFIQFMEQRYGTVPIVSQSMESAVSNDGTIINTITALDSLSKDTDDALSPLYQALERIGFIGCVDADEQWSVRYKDEIDFSHKCGEKR